MKDVGPNAESPLWQLILDIARYINKTANQFITYPLDNRKILLIFMLVSLSFDVRSFRRALCCLCLCPLYSCAAFIRCLITWNVVGIPMCICLCFHLIKMMMNRTIVFVGFLDTCYCVVSLSTWRLASLCSKVDDKYDRRRLSPVSPFCRFFLQYFLCYSVTHFLFSVILRYRINSWGFNLWSECGMWCKLCEKNGCGVL